MKHDIKLLGFYNYTVVLTYIGMLSGFMGVIYAFEGNTYASVICLMIAGFCDMFDGAVASTRQRTHEEKCFGIQIDSLSDLICFGVLPAVLVYSMNDHSTVALGVSCLYVLCALIRLAYFNVDEQERQKRSTGSRELYYGMPVTMSALFTPLLYGVCNFFEWRGGAVLGVQLFLLSALFLIPFPLKKPKFIGKICVLLCGIAEVVFVILACGDV